MRMKVLAITMCGAALVCFGIAIGISVAMRDSEDAAMTPTHEAQQAQSIAAAGAAPQQDNYSPSYENLTGIPTFSSAPPPLPGELVTAPVTPHEPYNFGPVRRAVEYDESVPASTGAPFITDENGNPMEMPAQPIGRNGLRGNPAVDPPSSHGAAYSRSY